MCAVGYEIFLPPERLAQTSFDHAEGDSRGEVTVSEHLNAIYRCVKKGWLEILTAEQCEREMARQESSPTIEFVDLLEPGVVSFTQKGYLSANHSRNLWRTAHSTDGFFLDVEDSDA